MNEPLQVYWVYLLWTVCCLSHLQELLIREFTFHQLNANLLWPGSFAFAEWLVQHKSWIEGKRIIELGRCVPFLITVIHMLRKGFVYVSYLWRVVMFLSYLQSLVSCFYANAFLTPLTLQKLTYIFYLHLILGLNYHYVE